MNFHQRLLEGVIFFFAITERFLMCWLVKSYVWPWKLRVGGAIYLSLSSTCNFPRNFNRNGHQKLSNVIVKTNQQQCSMVYTLIDQKNDVKMFKTLQWNHSPMACGSTGVLNSVNVISVVDKSTDHGKLCWFVKCGYIYACAQRLQILCLQPCWTSCIHRKIAH